MVLFAQRADRKDAPLVLFPELRTPMFNQSNVRGSQMKPLSIIMLASIVVLLQIPVACATPDHIGGTCDTTEDCFALMNRQPIGACASNRRASVNARSDSWCVVTPLLVRLVIARPRALLIALIHQMLELTPVRAGASRAALRLPIALKGRLMRGAVQLRALMGNAN
jgi:hypothetical protein